jgi:hypothetical protein
MALLALLFAPLALGSFLQGAPVLPLVLEGDSSVISKRGQQLLIFRREAAALSLVLNLDCAQHFSPQDDRHGKALRGKALPGGLLRITRSGLVIARISGIG